MSDETVWTVDGVRYQMLPRGNDRTGPIPEGHYIIVAGFQIDGQDYNIANVYANDVPFSESKKQFTDLAPHVIENTMEALAWDGLTREERFDITEQYIISTKAESIDMEGQIFYGLVDDDDDESRAPIDQDGPQPFDSPDSPQIFVDPEVCAKKWWWKKNRYRYMTTLKE